MGEKGCIYGFSLLQVRYNPGEKVKTVVSQILMEEACDEPLVLHLCLCFISV